MSSSVRLSLRLPRGGLTAGEEALIAAAEAANATLAEESYAELPDGLDDIITDLTSAQANEADHAASVATIEAGGYPADDPDLNAAVAAALADGAPSVASFDNLGAAGADGTRKTTSDSGLVWVSNGTIWLPQLVYDALDAGTFALGESLWADEIEGLSNTDPIDAWSGVGSWSQSGAARPTWLEDGGPGGGPAVDFSGSQSLVGDATARSKLNGNSYTTVICCLRWDSLNGCPYDYTTGNSSITTRLRARIQSSVMALDGRLLDTDGLAARPIALPVASTWGLLAHEALWADGDCQGWRSQSGLAVPSGGASALLAAGSWTSAGTLSTASQNAVLGSNAAGTLPFNGQMSAFLLLNHSARLSRPVLGAVMAWVAARARLV